jgi:hypothetical protein
MSLELAETKGSCDSVVPYILFNQVNKYWMSTYYVLGIQLQRSFFNLKKS